MQNWKVNIKTDSERCPNWKFYNSTRRCNQLYIYNKRKDGMEYASGNCKLYNHNGCPEEKTYETRKGYEPSTTLASTDLEQCVTLY